MRAIGTSWLPGARNSWPIVTGIAALLLATCMCLLVLRLPTRQPVTIDETNKQSACRTNSIALIKPERIDVPFLVQISDFCYGQVRGEDLLSDFYIRKLSFVQQQSDTRVLLWMVVAITISGVLLAGFQLLAAYRLASGGRGDLAQGGELSLDPKSISLKSSVTGIVILTLSLAFFIIYVKWIYPIETRMDPEVAATHSNLPITSGPNIPITLGTGGAGAVPETDPHPVATTGLPAEVRSAQSSIRELRHVNPLEVVLSNSMAP
jgi:hypothetical protein